MTIIIRFPDKASERRALGWLPGRFSFKSWATGEMLVPADALAPLAVEGIRFSVEGPAASQLPVRDVRFPSVIEGL
jgi:hypothetical protein